MFGWPRLRSRQALSVTEARRGASMTIRRIVQLVRSQPVTEGAGVTVRRTIGMPQLRHLDPFLMLDHFGSEDPDEYIAGFPDHPHRGFITFTYMLDGHMLHQDSMGNRGDLQSGGAQWMKAASGVIHSELPQQSAGLLRGFQLWINLPGAEKMSEPAYQEFAAEAFPTVEGPGLGVKVLIGEYRGVRGPIRDPHTDLTYLDVTLNAGATFEHPIAAPYRSFAYVFEGDLAVGANRVGTHDLLVLDEGDRVQVEAGDAAARFILVAGRPIGEPIVQSGPFVMSTEAELRQAFEDYRAGRLVRTRAQVVAG
jgi:redox-sensitive bicupin YhaK (pirin superfamily)